MQYQYNNSGYATEYAKGAEVPYKRSRYDFPRQQTAPGSTPTGSYSVGKAQAQAYVPTSHGVSANAPTPRGTNVPQYRVVPRENSLISKIRPESYPTRTPPTGPARNQVDSAVSDNVLDKSGDPNYLSADVDLSPTKSSYPSSSGLQQRGLSSPGSARSPVIAQAPFGYPDRSRLNSSQQVRSPLSLHDDMDRSTVSKESRDPSDPNRSGSSGTADSGNKSHLSYRERWEMNRGTLPARADTSGPIYANTGRGGIYTPRNLGGDRVPSRSALSQYDENLSRSVPVIVGSDNIDKIRNFQSPTPDKTRSIISRDLKDGDHNKSSTSAHDFIYTHDQSVSGSLKRDPLTHRKIPINQQNGNARPVRDNLLGQSRRSLTLSRHSLNKGVTLYGRGYGVHNSLVNMAFSSVVSLIMAILATQLLYRVTSRAAPSLPHADSVLHSNLSFLNVGEVVVALSSISVMLDLCCLLTCAMQGYFAAKLIKCPQGQERAFRYLKECMPTRFIAICGFFISIPVFLIALMLFILMEYRSTAAIVATVVMTIGISFSISMTVHTSYVWHAEKARADSTIPAYDSLKRRPPNPEGTLSQSELSTLV